MSLIVSRLVLCVPFTVRYSQLHILKKKAPFVSWPRAVSRGVKLFSSSFRNTDKGSAFSCFELGSASIQPLNYRVRNNDVFMSGSNAGSGRRFVLKDERIFVMVDLTIFSVQY